MIGDKPGKLVVDFEGVNAIDSIGLGVLISARNRLKKSGGELVVTNVSKDIFHLLQQMHLDCHIVFKPAD